MTEQHKTIIKDLDELKEFIKINQQRADYFDRIIERVISKNSR